MLTKIEQNQRKGEHKNILKKGRDEVNEQLAENIAAHRLADDAY